MIETDEDIYPTLPGREADPADQALAAWFAEQHLKSLDNLEAAARQIVTLTTTLLGALLGLLALTEEKVPPALEWGAFPWLSGAGVVALFFALACALYVLLPRGTTTIINDPDQLRQSFDTLRQQKRWGLIAALVAFGVAMLFFMLVVLISLAQ